MPLFKPIISLASQFASHPLTRNAQLSAWWRFGKWQLQSRLREEIAFSWIEGQKLAVRRGMTGATGNIYAGLHEFADMMVVLHFLRPGDLFFDIGANIGSFSVLASGVCRAKTWAFEPDPATMVSFKRNVAINRLDQLVTAFELALGSERDNVRFTVGLDSMNRVAPDGELDARFVQQEKLDDLVGPAEPIMIKVDVEGYEEKVLRGANALLGRPCMRVLELETVTPGVEAILRSHRFKRAFYDPFTRSLNREPTTVPASNALYVRDWEFVASRLSSAEPVRVFDRVL